MSISMNTKTMTSHCPQQAPSVWAKMATFFAINHQRRQLLALDDHMLADIGVTRKEALEESRQMTWDVPQGWRK